MRQKVKNAKKPKKIQKNFQKSVDKRHSLWYNIIRPIRNAKRWCGSMAEQLICNQQVVGSTPITSSKQARSAKRALYGGFPERPKGADCKSVVTDFGGPNPPSPTNKKELLSTKSSFLLSKPQAWHIITARSAVHIINGGLPPLHIITR